MMRTNRSMWLGLAVVTALSGGSATLAATDGPGATGLVAVVLKATERYRDPAEADAQGWKSADACVSGPEEGAMGVHFIKGSILFDGKIDPQEPEALIYEVKRGRARLVGVEYIVIAVAVACEQRGGAAGHHGPADESGRRPRTATGSTPSTSCTSGPGVRTSRAPSSTGTPPCRAPASSRRSPRIRASPDAINPEPGPARPAPFPDAFPRIRP